MSYYFSANNQYLRRSTGGFPAYGTTSTSVLVWAKRSATVAAAACIFGASDGGANYVYLYSSTADGVRYDLEGGGGINVTGPSMALDAWYCFAWTVIGGTRVLNLYYRIAPATTWTTGGGVAIPAAFTATNEVIGANDFAITTSTFRGRIAGLRVWDSVLTADQLMRESLSPVPLIRPFNWYPMDRIMTGADASGNGRTMIMTGAPTLAEQPQMGQPVARRWRYGDKAATVVAGKAMPVFGALYRPQLRRQRVVYSQ